MEGEHGMREGIGCAECGVSTEYKIHTHVSMALDVLLLPGYTVLPHRLEWKAP